MNQLVSTKWLNDNLAKVKIIPLTKGYSTTKFIERICNDTT